MRASRRGSQRSMRCAVIFLMAFTALVFLSILARLLLSPVRRVSVNNFVKQNLNSLPTPSTPPMVTPQHSAVDFFGETRWVSRQLGMSLSSAVSVESLRERLVHSPHELPPLPTAAASAAVNVSCEEHNMEAHYSHKGDTAVPTTIQYVYGSTPSTHRRGVMLLFHGCSHGGRDVCPSSPGCPNCRGLPEEWRAARVALQMGFDVLALTSTNRQSKCWAMSRAVTKGDSPFWNNRDVFHLLTVLKHRGLLGQNVPLVAMGASSGGQFVQHLPLVLGAQLVGIIAQIAAPPIVAHPSTLIFYDEMKRDGSTASRAKAMCKRRGMAPPTLMGGSEEGVFDSERRTGYFERSPISFTPTTLSDRIEGFPLAASKAVFHALQDAGLLDPATARLTMDPRHQRGKWVPVVAKTLQQVRIADKLTADVSPIAEVMNVVYGFHEFFSDHVSVMLHHIVQSY